MLVTPLQLDAGKSACGQIKLAIDARPQLMPAERPEDNVIDSCLEGARSSVPAQSPKRDDRHGAQPRISVIAQGGKQTPTLPARRGDRFKQDQIRRRTPGRLEGQLAVFKKFECVPGSQQSRELVPHRPVVADHEQTRPGRPATATRAGEKR